jgi:hypothetical protein
MMLLAQGVVNNQGWRPADVELLHEIGALVPEALAFYRYKFLFQIALNRFVGIRTRIQRLAADSAVEPEILKNGFVGLAGQLERLLKIFLPVDRSHDMPPFWNQFPSALDDYSTENVKVTSRLRRS